MNKQATGVCKASKSNTEKAAATERSNVGVYAEAGAYADQLREHGDKPFRLVRPQELPRITGFSPSMIYQLQREGRFPKPIAVTERTRAYPDFVIYQYMREIVSGKAV